MLVAAAVVPGPPALVPELMGAAAHELDGLRQAADLALRTVVADLRAASGDSAARLVVAGPGAVAAFDARGPVDFAEFGRDVRLPALPGAVEVAAVPLPTPLMVARYLAYRVCASADPDDVRVWSEARWVTADAEGARVLGSRLREDPCPHALVLVADGATCHGPKAPRAEDSRAGAWEESACEALASGDPASLGRIDAALATELGATGPDLWPALQAAAAGEQWQADLLWQGAPYGVGWAVALWRRRS